MHLQLLLAASNDQVTERLVSKHSRLQIVFKHKNIHTEAAVGKVQSFQ